MFFSVVGNDGVFLRASLFPENQWRLMGIYTKLAVSLTGIPTASAKRWEALRGFQPAPSRGGIEKPYLSISHDLSISSLSLHHAAEESSFV